MIIMKGKDIKEQILLSAKLQKEKYLGMLLRKCKVQRPKKLLYHKPSSKTRNTDI